jgi:hypothetical protein
MLKNFFDNAPLCMGITELVDDDKDSVNLFLNPASAKLFGKQSPADAVGIRYFFVSNRVLIF